MLSVRCPWPLGLRSAVCTLCVLCAASLATWLLFTAVPTRSSVCAVSLASLGSCSPVCTVSVLRVRCPRPLGSCSAVFPLGTFCCVCGVIGHLATLHRCARLVCCVCGVLGHLAPVHRCVCLVCGLVCALSLTTAVSLTTWLLFTGVQARCVACAVSWANRLLFSSVLARCVASRLLFPWRLGSCSSVCLLGVLCARCPWPLGSCSPVCPLGVLCCTFRVLDHLPPVRQCARFRCCAFSALGQLAPVHRCAGLLCCVCVAVGHLTPVHRCAPAVYCVACGLFLATWRLFTGVRPPLFFCGVCSSGRLWFLGTWSCAVVVAGSVSLWRASWPCILPGASSCPVALDVPVVFPVPVVPAYNRAQGFLLLAPAAAAALCLLRVVPVQGPVMGMSQASPSGVSPGVQAAVILGVLTPTLTRLLSCNVRLLTVDSAGAPGLYRVDADSSLFGSEDATPGSGGPCVSVVVFPRVSVVSLAGLCGVLARLGGPASRTRSGALHCSCCCFGFLSAPSGLRLPVLCVFFRAPPLCPSFRCFQPLGILGLGALWLPPSLRPRPVTLFSAPPLCLASCCFRPQVPSASALCGPPPSSFFFLSFGGFPSSGL